MTRPLDLPGILAEIAQIAGDAAALQVAAAKGGLEKVHFPHPGRLKPGHWLVEAVGIEAALRIAAVLGGAKLDIPLGPLAGSRNRARQALRRALGEGSSPAAAARLAGVHQRTARRHKCAPAAPSAQLGLPLPD